MVAVDVTGLSPDLLLDDDILVAVTIRIANANTPYTINEIVTVNGIRFTLEDGSWGLVRASSNKPSLVVVIESVESVNDIKVIFTFINKLLKATGKIGQYDQKI